MAPLRNAMGFIHSYKAHIETLQIIVEQAGLQPFGGNIEQFVIAVKGGIQNMLHIIVIHTTMDRRCFYAQRYQSFYLVLHQSY